MQGVIGGISSAAAYIRSYLSWIRLVLLVRVSDLLKQFSPQCVDGYHFVIASRYPTTQREGLHSGLDTGAILWPSC